MDDKGCTKIVNDFTIVALLLSDNPKDHKLQQEIVNTIYSDSLMKQYVYIINIDNPMLKNWVKYNKSGVRVTQLPMFVVRQSNKYNPDLYTPQEYTSVVKIVHQLHNDTIQLISGSNKSKDLSFKSSTGTSTSNTSKSSKSDTMESVKSQDSTEFRYLQEHITYPASKVKHFSFHKGETNEDSTKQVYMMIDRIRSLIHTI